MVEIFFILPLMFIALDGFIRHTSLKLGFYKGTADTSETAESTDPEFQVDGTTNQLQSSKE